MNSAKNNMAPYMLLLVVALTNAAADLCTWKNGEEPGYYNYCDVPDSNEAFCHNYVSFKLNPCLQDNRVEDTNYMYSLIINLVDPRENDLFLVDTEKIVKLRIKHGNLIHLPKDVCQMRRLTELAITDNKIKIIPSNFASRLNEIEHLNFSNNMIENINLYTFKGLTQLKTLDLSHNRLVTIGRGLEKLTSLRRLRMSNNNITKLLSIDFVQLTELESIEASFNNIDYIEANTFETLTNLKVLDLGNNKIRVISAQYLNKNIKLYSLSLLNNNIHSIEANAFISNPIIEFHIKNNIIAGAIEKGTFNNVNVRKLDLSGCKFITISDGAFTDMSLLELNLSSNNIRHISDFAFSALELLLKLDISWNKLKELEFKSDSLINLVIFHAHHNKLESINENILKSMLSLKELDLSHNEIKNVEAYQFVNNLKHLNISFNFNLEMVGEVFSNVSHLEVLSLAKVKTVNFCNIKLDVEVLEMQFCNIADINNICIYNIRNVRRLFLSSNEITSVTKNSFKGMSVIVYLDLSNNKITAIQPGAFSATVALSIINLYGNNITTIEAGVFDKLLALKELNLAKNKLSTFDINLAPSITKLSLDDNMITYLDFKRLLASKVKKLSVGGNHIPCKDLADFKFSNYSENFQQTVTTERLNYCSANVNGITCQNADARMNFHDCSNVNISPILSLLTNTLEKISVSLQNIEANEMVLKNIIKKT